MIPALLVGPDVRTLKSQATGVNIPCISARGLVFMAFDPTPEEKQLISMGCPVWVVARGPFIPELTLRVGQKGEVVPHDLQRAAIQENVPGGDDHEQVVRRYRADREITGFDRVMGKLILWAMVAVSLWMVYLVW
jgi:hypothetical protein